MTETLVQSREPKAGRGTWRLSWRGVRLITELELKQRVRSTKWKWALAVFAAIVGVVTLPILPSFVGQNSCDQKKKSLSRVWIRPGIRTGPPI